MTVSLAELASALAAAKLQLSVEDAVLYLSILKRLWNHIEFEGQLPTYLPANLQEFLRLCLETTTPEALDMLWETMKGYVPLWEASAGIVTQVDDCFRRLGPQHNLGRCLL
jgi:hypothetical protein